MNHETGAGHIPWGRALCSGVAPREHRVGHWVKQDSGLEGSFILMV